MRISDWSSDVCSSDLIGDMGEYIPKADYAAAKAADPYPRFRQWLQDQGHASDAELDAIDAAVRQEIAEAEAFAMRSPPPDAIAVQRDVYAYEIACVRQ